MNKLKRIIDRELDKFLKKHKTVNLETEEIYHIPKEKLEKFMIDIMRLKEMMEGCEYPNCECTFEGYVRCYRGNKE